MKQLRLKTWVSVSVVAVVLITVLLLSSFTAWISTRELRNRHDAYSFYGDYFPDDVHVLVLQMNSLLVILEINPELSDTIRPKFYRLARVLSAELAQMNFAEAGKSRQKDFSQIREEFEDYLEAAKQFLEAPRGSLLLRDRLEGLDLIYQKAQRPVLELEQLSKARRQTLADIAAGYGQAHERLVWLVFILSGVASVLVGGTAVIYLLNRVGNLHLEMSELQLARQREEQLASLGILAAGVAHEIRNPLTAIKARLFSLERNINSESEAGEQATEIGNEINRLEKIVKEVLLFARPPNPQIIVFEVEPLLAEVEHLLKSELESFGVQLEVPTDQVLCARGDVDLTKQVLINLIQNAADVSKSGDVLKIAARKQAHDGKKAGSGQVAIDIVDKGPGIPMEDSDKFFSPFFTTKPKGTGLGLSISRKLAQIQGGDLTFKTRTSQGTTFTLTLPSAD